MREMLSQFVRRRLEGIEILLEIVGAIYQGRELAIAWRDAETLAAFLAWLL